VSIENVAYRKLSIYRIKRLFNLRNKNSFFSPSTVPHQRLPAPNDYSLISCYFLAMFVINDAMIDSPPSTQSEILNSGIRGEIRSLLVEGGAGEDEENPLNRAISDFVSVCGLINVKNDDSSGKGETIVVDLLANLFSGISSLPSPQSGVVKICASDADGPSSDDSRLRFGEPTTLLGAISVRLANVFPNTR